MLRRSDLLPQSLTRTDPELVSRVGHSFGIFADSRQLNTDRAYNSNDRFP